MRFLGFGFVIVIIFIFGIEPHNISACSGGGRASVASIFNNADYVVRAQVMEADKLGQNFVLRIEQHYKSEGPEYALVVRNASINLRYIDAGLSSGGDCIGLLREFSSGTIIYGGLNRMSDGSYRLGQVHRPSFESTFITLSQEEELEVETENLEVELERIFTEYSDFVPVPPIPSAYPLKATLIIQTDQDSYVLPIDYGELTSLTAVWNTLGGHIVDQYPPACFTDGCVTRSPDGLNMTSQPNDDTIVFVDGEQVVGNSVLFSSTSDAVAVWHECELVIYTTGYTIYGHVRYEIDELKKKTLATDSDCENYHANAVWSPDGRILAYADVEGVWLWDVYSQIDPQLLLASGSDLTIRYFSPLGRYLAITEGDVSYNLDIFTNQKFPDGIVSPTDRLLLSFDTSVQDAEIEVCSLTPFSCQLLGMYIQIVDENGELTSITDTRTARAVKWIGNSTFLVLTCHPEIENTCRLFRWLPRVAYAGWQIPNVVGYGYAFDYTTDSRQLAVVYDETTIIVDGVQIDLSGQIEGTIESVEWSESFFNTTHP